MKNKICIGTMLWGTKTSSKEAHKIINTALDYGINFFDTAQKYPTFPYSSDTRGASEKILGNWIKNNKKKIKISTKLLSPVMPNKIKKLVDDSLIKLNINSIDYLHFHMPLRNHYHFRNVWNYTPIGNKNKMFNYFEKCSLVLNTLQAEGKIKNICMSNETAWGITEWSRRLNLYAIQNEYSLLHRLFELDVAEACYYNNVKLFAWSPLAGGLLTGKYSEDYSPQNSRRTYGGLGPRNNKNVWPAIYKYCAIAKEYEMTLTQMSLAWIFSNPLLKAAIVGVTNAEQLKENLKFKFINNEIISKIQKVYKDYPLPF